MHLLVGITNIQHWCDSLKESPARPRLPLPYTFSTAFHRLGHKVSAINLSKRDTSIPSTYPFEVIYQRRQLLEGMKNVDIVLLWGRHGISAILKQILLLPPRRCVLLGSYIWQLSTLSTMRTKGSGIATRIFAKFSRALVLMTDEQSIRARKQLPFRISVIRFNCGIDTRFYKIKSNYSDVPKIHLSSIDELVKKPYVIMLGDQQRCNKDALELIKNSDTHLVRVFRGKRTSEWYAEHIRTYGSKDRLFIFENIDYGFLRFLLQNASAYVGLVDSRWQPAGWTVACEALASGLPIVLYEGLVSRELSRLGVGDAFFRSVPMHDICSFQKEMEHFTNVPRTLELEEGAKGFAQNNLDLERTGLDFVEQVEVLVNQVHG